jgi:cellulose synthase/poly-beta-1,6-N-acetylglucosamine synthase-like glycosyltransferase
VVVPAYNAERTVVDTVQSALAQTFTDLELLVVDDGSTDGTVGRLEAIRDPRLAVRSVSHAGLAATRNRGIAATRGALVAFLDADDLWTPDKLACQVAALDAHPEAGAAYSWVRFVDAAGHPVGAQRAVSLTGDVYAALLVENIAPSGSNLLVRRGALEDVGGFDPACQVSEDWELAVRLAARWPFVVVPRHQVFYRQTPGSMTAGLSASPERWAEAMRAVVDRVFAAVPPPLQGLKRRRLARVHLYIAHRSLLHAVDVGAVRRAGRQLREALRLDPALLLEPTARRVSARWFLTWGLGGRVACRLTAWARRRA